MRRNFVALINQITQHEITLSSAKGKEGVLRISQLVVYPDKVVVLGKLQLEEFGEIVFHPYIGAFGSLYDKLTALPPLSGVEWDEDESAILMARFDFDNPTTAHELKILARRSRG